jgi:7-carboxy-7-deazaguanine synthase
MKVREIVREVVKLNTINVTITGGEPLLQKGTPNLIRKLSFHGKKVSIETNGTVFIPLISDSERVKWVVDYKLPSSGYENEDVIYKNFRNLLSHDFVKFVVADRKDFDRAVEVIPLIRNEVSYSFGPKFALSPVWGSLKPETLAQWMIKNEELCKIGAIYSLQIHKILSVK